MSTLGVGFFLPGSERRPGPTPSPVASVSLPVFRVLSADSAPVLTSRSTSFVVGWGWGKVWPPDVWGRSRGGGSKPAIGQEAGHATLGYRPRGTAYDLGIASVLNRIGVEGQSS